MTITPAFAKALENVGREADRARKSVFFGHFINGVAGKIGPRCLHAYHLYDLDPAHRIEALRALLKTDRAITREGRTFLIPATRAALCGLLVAEGRAMRRTRKIARRFAPAQAAE